MCGVATNKEGHVILNFDIVSEIIIFEEKGGFGKEKHQNLLEQDVEFLDLDTLLTNSDIITVNIPLNKKSR